MNQAGRHAGMNQTDGYESGREAGRDESGRQG